ncbi:ZPR1 zinc finger domain-containing protein [Candidatus Woesearchaeota archaeon]|nr:ZPR1 zinc finger domain-containing protein [Candidatus Woesearchaeota archaeon]
MAAKQEELAGQECPVCQKKTLMLRESEDEIPYFGKVYMFSMSCSSCRFHKADVESAEQRDPVKCSIEISGDKDASIRIVKSGQATVKIPHIVTIEPGVAANGYITNVEGLLNRVKHQLEATRDEAEDPAEKKKAKNMLKKISRALYGSDKLKIIIEDPSGNSAIISDKAVVEKLKVKH